MRTSWRVCLALLLAATLAARVSAGRDVIELTEKTFTQQVLNDESGVWFVKFYAPWCGHCKALAPKWDQLATSIKGMINVAKVDCTVHQSLCGRYQVQGYPTLKVFAADKKKPIDYQGPREAAPMSKFALSHLSSANVQTIAASDLDAFLAKDGGKVVLFTDKKTTPPLMKALGNAFVGAASFAEVRNAKDTASKYGASKLPALVAFPAGATDGVVFDGKLKFDKLQAWVSATIGDAAGAGDSGDAASDSDGNSDDSNKGSQRVTTPPPPSRPAFITELSKSNFDTMCVARKGICAVFYLPLLDADATAGDTAERYLRIAEETRKVVMSVFDRYHKDKLTLVWADAAAQPKLFPEQAAAPTLVLAKVPRQRVAALDAEAGFELASISALLDRAIGGDAKFQRVDELPAFVDV